MSSATWTRMLRSYRFLPPVSTPVKWEYIYAENGLCQTGVFRLQTLPGWPARRPPLQGAAGWPSRGQSLGTWRSVGQHLEHCRYSAVQYLESQRMTRRRKSPVTCCSSLESGPRAEYRDRNKARTPHIFSAASPSTTPSSPSLPTTPSSPSTSSPLFSLPSCPPCLLQGRKTPCSQSQASSRLTTWTLAGSSPPPPAAPPSVEYRRPASCRR